MIILLANNAATLLAALNQYDCYAAVEAEFGTTEVKGSSELLTLNHHIDESQPCPCSVDPSVFDSIRGQIEAVGLSHFDLDTLGGIMALKGIKPERESFWALTEYVDLNGPHRVKENILYNERDHILLASFWAWSKENRLFPNRDGSVSDVSDFVERAEKELIGILNQEEEKVQRGKDFLKKEEDLKHESFVTAKNSVGVVLRKSTEFVNHLYYDHRDLPQNYIVGFNSDMGKVTVSRAGDEGINCKEFVQSLWGEGAGGREGIAGSPREGGLTFDDALQAYKKLVEKLSQ
ncbi:hypothetical protein GF420_15655 [candidate division GN15 bacterium]|nr:hypothetical protein [candidate division GN15 bacterium]